MQFSKNASETQSSEDENQETEKMSDIKGLRKVQDKIKTWREKNKKKIHQSSVNRNSISS